MNLTNLSKRVKVQDIVISFIDASRPNRPPTADEDKEEVTYNYLKRHVIKLLNGMEKENVGVKDVFEVRAAAKATVDTALE